LSFHEDFLRTEEIRDTLHKTEMPNLKQRGGSCSSDSQVTEKHHPSLASQDDELVELYLDRDEVKMDLASESSYEFEVVDAAVDSQQKPEKEEDEMVELVIDDAIMEQVSSCYPEVQEEENKDVGEES